MGCVFARQVWTLILQQLGLLQLAPQPTVTRFSGWWKRSIAAVPKEAHKGLNSLIILVAWKISRNSCVFDNKRPNIQEVIRAVSLEGGLGARLEPPNSKNLFLGRCLLELKARRHLVVSAVFVASL